MLMRVGVLRVVRDRFAEAVDGARHLLTLLVDEPHPVEELGVLRFELDGLPDGVDRLAELTLSGEGACEVVLSLAVLVVREPGLSQLDLRLVELAALDQQGAEPRAVAEIL